MKNNCQVYLLSRISSLASTKEYLILLKVSPFCAKVNAYQDDVTVNSDNLLLIAAPTFGLDYVPTLEALYCTVYTSCSRASRV